MRLSYARFDQVTMLCIKRVSVGVIESHLRTSAVSKSPSRVRPCGRVLHHMTFSFFFFSVELFQKAHLFLIPFQFIHHVCVSSAVSNIFVFRFSEHLSLDSLLLRLDSLRSFSLLQITPSVAGGKREGAFGHFGTPWAHGQGEEVVFVLLSGAGRGRDHCRRCRRSCESGFFERLETSG